MNHALNSSVNDATRPIAIPTASAMPAASARLAHLFRASLSQGRLHPLYVPMLQYRGTAMAGPA